MVVVRVWSGPAVTIDAWICVAQVRGEQLLSRIKAFSHHEGGLCSCRGISPSGPANEVVPRKMWGRADFHWGHTPLLPTVALALQLQGMCWSRSIKARSAVARWGCSTVANRLIGGRGQTGWDVEGVFFSPGWPSRCERKFLNSPRCQGPWHLACVHTTVCVTRGTCCSLGHILRS